MKVECDKCDYVWETESRLAVVACPSCRKPLKIRDKVLKE